MHQPISDELEEAEARTDWWQENAIQWAEMCKKAWKDRDYLRERCEWLEAQLIEERGYL